MNKKEKMLVTFAMEWIDMAIENVNDMEFDRELSNKHTIARLDFAKRRLNGALNNKAHA